MTQLDEELRELAALTLRNAFWHDFSALANKYLAASKGLDMPTQEMQMSEQTSIYGRDTKAKSDAALDISSKGVPSLAIRKHETICEALERESATEVFLCGKKVFERRDGEWYLTDQPDFVIKESNHG